MNDVACNTGVKPERGGSPRNTSSECDPHDVLFTTLRVGRLERTAYNRLYWLGRMRVAQMPGSQGHAYRHRDTYRWAQWVARARTRLLVDLAPRIGALSGRMYDGAGFHYDMVQQVGRLLTELAITKMPADSAERLITEVRVEGLFEDVARAERSARARKPAS